VAQSILRPWLQSFEDKTGNKPKIPDHFADNFINQLITEYANLTGEMSKTEEVTRKLNTATEKFSPYQRQMILDIAGLIDARKADIDWMQMQSVAEEEYRAWRQASSDEVVAAMKDVNDYVDAVQLETNVLELQANMRGQATSEVQKAIVPTASMPSYRPKFRRFRKAASQTV